MPVRGDLACRPGSRLAERVMLGRGERRTLAHLVRPVVVVPALAGFKACNDPMTRPPGVSTGMLCGRRIATPDMAAVGTAPQMKPPPTVVKALNTAITARRHARVNQGASHRQQATHPSSFEQTGRACRSAASIVARCRGSMPNLGGRASLGASFCTPANRSRRPLSRGLSGDSLVGVTSGTQHDVVVVVGVGVGAAWAGSFLVKLNVPSG